MRMTLACMHADAGCAEAESEEVAELASGRRSVLALRACVAMQPAA